jgi:hypothetical protein
MLNSSNFSIHIAPRYRVDSLGSDPSEQEIRGNGVKPFIVVLWVLSIALAVGLTRLSGPDPAGSDASPSLDEAFSELDPLQRAYLFNTALHELGSDAAPELKAVFENHAMGLVDEETRLLMLAWVRHDAPGAYEWAASATPRWSKTLIGQAMYAWGYHDAREAMRYVDEIEDAELKSRLRKAAIEGWLRSKDKEGVTEFIASYEDMGRRGRLLFVLAGEMVMAEGMDGAMRWAESLPDEPPFDHLKKAVFNHIGKMVAGDDDPERAANWFVQHRDQPFSKGALDGIIRRWVQHHDRPAAFEWLLAMSTEGEREGKRGGERDDAISAGFRSWIQIDPDAAQAWLLGQLPNPDLDIAIKETSKRLTPTDPNLALEWSLRLDDETARHQVSVRVGLRWQSSDPKAFEAWLMENDFPEETLETIQRRAPKMPMAPRLNLKPKPAAAKP